MIKIKFTAMQRILHILAQVPCAYLPDISAFLEGYLADTINVSKTKNPNTIHFREFGTIVRYGNDLHPDQIEKLKNAIDVLMRNQK